MASDIDIEANIASEDPTVRQYEPMEPDCVEENTSPAYFLRFRNRVRDVFDILGGLLKGTLKEPKRGSRIHFRKSIDDYPNGYPRIGAFITADRRHLIFRRFHYLQARVLLNLQSQLRQYEIDLDSLDEQLSATSLSKEHGEAFSRRRSQLLRDIEDKFAKYIALVNAISSASQKQEPPEIDYKNLEAFFKAYAPFRVEEMYYLHKSDLVSLEPSEDTAMMDTRFMEFLLDAPGKLTQKIFRNPSADRDGFLILHNNKKVKIAIAFLLGIPLIVLLVGPIYPLYRLSQGEMTEGTLVGIMFIQVGFTCAFACCLKYMTRPRRHELFACTVAYLGVLLVFMSQTLQKSH
ncbi:hypothetical protein GGS26DRAFT_605043 [Hypomontagnella submonticulosa]|nr:hypothetical protein GGS26DRAFT_605043 [Hypomontagnella submonticulosa]